MRPLALDLCAGAGGGTIGLEAAGYRTVSFDNWQPARDTTARCRPLSRRSSDGFTFTGNRTAIFKQIGNAVPPPMAYLVATANAASIERAEAVPA